MIIYFSGTGNSRYCAELLAQQLQDNLLDAFQYMKNGIGADLVSGRPWVFVSPTYAWQLPRVFADFIRSGSFSGSSDAYFVMTCGSDIGDAPAVNAALCAEKQLNHRGTLELIMPENYVAMFPVPSREQTLQIVRAAEPILEAAGQKILAGQPLTPHPHRPGDGLKSGFINRAFYPLFVKAKAFTVSDACISCGKCAEQCVTNNIVLQQGRPVWGQNCTHCMACICGCPSVAIEYGRKSIGKPRYQCPV